MNFLKSILFATALSGLAVPASAALYSHNVALNAGQSYTFTSAPIASTQLQIDDSFQYRLAAGISSVQFLFNLGLPGRELNVFSVTPLSGSVSPAVSGGSNWVSTTYIDEDGETITVNLLSKIEHQWGVVGLNELVQQIDLDADFVKSLGRLNESVSYTLTVTAGPASVVSEPASLALALSGLAFMAGLARRRVRNAKTQEALA